MYKAIVCAITTYRHPDADRIQLGKVSGYQVVIGNDIVNGTIGVFFGPDGQISQEFADANDLVGYTDPVTGEKKGGFFPKNLRVKAQKFRGERSEGFWTELNSFAFTGYDLSKLKEGDQFDELNGVPICNKYITAATRQQMNRRAGPKVYKTFAKHIDTPKLRDHAHRLTNKPGIYIITEKVHGTCLSKSTRVRMADGSKTNIADIKSGDTVLGVDTHGQPVPSLVSHVWNHGVSNDWLRVEVSRSFARSDQAGNTTACLYVTPEHQFLTPDGYKEAQFLGSDDFVFIERQDIEPSHDQWQILLGKLLGDGSLTTSSKYSAGLAFRHKKPHEAYVDYCISSLGNLGGSGIKSYPISGYGSEMVRVTTKYSCAVRDKFLSFYPDKKKSIPNWVHNVMGPIAIAFWYMDDGSLSHSENQKDRANFATCGFSFDDCEVLCEGLRKNGITNTTVYQDPKGYWRIRVNADSADIMFQLISPYIVDVMRYKLPIYYRPMPNTAPVYENGSQKSYLREEKILSISKPNMSNRCKQRFDLTTTTGNFIANDVVVHNSGRLGYVSVTNERKRSLFRYLFRRPAKVDTGYQYLHGTRNTVLAPGQIGGYFADESFRHASIANIVERGLYKGEVLYYELAGFTTTGQSIMDQHDTSELKEVKKQYGSKMVYKYGNDEKQCSIHVYRITQVNEDGVVFELPWNQVKRRCKELMVNHVPELYVHYGAFGWSQDLSELVDKFTGGPSILDSSHIREGVVLRVEADETHFYKEKSFDFLVLEGIIKNNDEYVDLEEIS